MGPTVEQQEAVRFDRGVCLLMAAPGTGKTYVVSQRFNHLVRCGADPLRILCVTFTRIAAEEMCDRIRALRPELAARDLSKQVCTFHSLGMRALLAERPFEINSRDGVAKDSLIRGILGRLLTPGIRLSDARSYISLAKRSGVSPETVLGEGEHRDVSLQSIYRRYAETLREMHMVDYDDMVFEFFRMLMRDADVRERYQSRYEHILVDEFQDTNHIQQAVTSLLGKRTKSLMCVGDPFQSIYAFCGADCSVIENFGNYFPGHQRMLLSENFRSTKRIVAMYKQAIRKPPESTRVLLTSMHSNRQEGEAWDRAVFENPHEEASQVAATIQHHGPPFSRYAVLFRTNFQLRPMEDELQERGIPYVSPGCGFYGRKEVRLALSFLKMALNPDAREATNCPCFHGRCGKCKEGIRISWVGMRVLKSGLPFLRGASPLSAQVASLKPGQEYAFVCASQTAVAKRFVAMVENLREYSRRYPDPATVLRTLYEWTDYLRWLRENEDLDEMGDNSRETNAVELVRAASRFTDLRLLLAFTAVSETVPRRNGKSAAARPAVTLSTIHKAKGREWDTVFVCGVTTGLLPHERATNLDEEDRILYVALSRAKNKLYVSSCGEPSWFLNEAT